MTRVRVLVAAVLILAVGASCERSRPAPRNDTTTAVVPPRDSASPTPAAPPAWDTSAGAALVVAGQEPGEAFVIFPEFVDGTELDTARFDLDRVRNIRIDLFSRGQPVGQAILDSVRVIKTANGCTAWPAAHVVAAQAGNPLPSWTVGFETSRVSAMPLDSIEALSKPDSLRLVAEVARMASALPGDTATAFRGLPFVVRTARRFEAAPGVQALVAEVVRKVNQEASPLQEQLLIVAERDSTATDGRYAPVYTERMSGREESLESTDILGVIGMGSEKRPAIIIGRDDGSSTSFSLLERTHAGPWRLRWSSAFAGC
jgi:hypothetical protein